VRIEFTVTAGDQSADVAVQTSDTTEVASVLAALRTAAGAGPGAAAWCAGEPIDPSRTFAAAGLRRGSVVSFGGAPREQRRTALLALHVVGGRSAGLVVPLDRGRLTIGRAPGNDVVLDDPDVSRQHAVLEVGAASITLRDLASTNGTRVDGVLLPASGCPVRPGAVISLGDSLLMLAGPVEAPAITQPAGDGCSLVLRAPRHRHRVPDGEVSLPTRSTAHRPRGVQWIAVLAPAAAGCAIAWFAHAPQFLLFTLLSPLVMASTALGDRLHWRRSRRAEAASYRQRRAAAEREIADRLADEALVRRAAAPDPAALLRQVTLPGSRLWERGRNDPDALVIRLGCADLPSTLRVREGTAVRSAGTVAAVPLCVDLRAGPLGIAGPPDVLAGMGRWLVGQLAALHSPADVELALLLDAGGCERWAWARWLPHLRATVAACAEEWTALVAAVTAVIDERCREPAAGGGRWSGRWLVLVIDRAGRLSEVPGLSELLVRGASVGITAICLDPVAASLPTACTSVARIQGMTGTRVVLRVAEGAETSAVIDQVSPSWAADVGRGLAPLLDAGASRAAALPARCGLPDVLGLPQWTPEAIEARWTSSDGAARAALGQTADGVLEIDLVRDGPHALIAGTTGAGKSALLQTLVAGLATNHPPDELNFLLIDYKGGAAFAECARLPHAAGLVTDLDGYLTERALRALHSELRHRERLFADAAVGDLASYRAVGAVEPVARLIIVVDEFAALANELPEFLRGLVGVAQRGRSLGVHLILATQRPGSVVSADIRANTDLRIALRVTDPAESTDVVASPVAARIDRTCPGRAYLRAGGVLTCFQAAHAGGVTSDAPTKVEQLGPWLRRSPTAAGTPAGADSDLARLVAAVAAAADRSGRAVARRPWSPPLPELLARSSLDPAASDTVIGFGLLDLPDERRVETLAFDVGESTSLLVAGGSRSGRTGALASLAAGLSQLDPCGLHLYVIDAAGTLSAVLHDLPHCATSVAPPDLALAPRLLSRLEQESARRTAAPGGHDQPAIVLLIDGWDALFAALPDLDAAACSDALAGLLRVSASTRISVAVTGDRSLLAPRFAGGFAQRILLRLADRNDYALAGIRARDIPVRLPPGRGVRAADGAVVQLAHAGNSPDLDAVRREVARAVARWGPVRSRPNGGPIRIRPLPRCVELTALGTPEGRFTMGLGGDGCELVAVDPFAGAGRILVAGPPRSGRTTVLRLLARQAKACGIATLVAATSRSPLADEAARLTIPSFGPDDADPPLPSGDRTLLLVDDSEAFTDTPAGDALAAWARSQDPSLAVVAAARSDELATSYRGIAVDVRRNQCGILLRPGPLDGELLGVRLARRADPAPPGRGIAVGDPSWGQMFAHGDAVPIQVAAP
jgi:DNA segregation ATPase FtsK/SpoIIIE, S-DNA-T family